MKTQPFFIIAVFAAFCFCTQLAKAQPNLSAKADKTIIKTGEPIQLSLRAAWPGQANFSNGFSIPDTIAHFDIWEKQNPTNTANGLEQTLTLTSYDSGRFTIPPFVLISSNADTKKMYKTDSITITVMPVNVDSLLDYHDIKDIVEVPPIPQWPYMVGMALAAATAIIILVFLLKKLNTASAIKKPSIAPTTAYQIALAALVDLENEIKTNAITAKLFFTKLLFIYRNYLQQAHSLQSMQQTGNQIILQLKPILTETIFYPLAQTIRLADAVKFAKYNPPKQEWAANIKIIKQAIEGMKS